METKTPQTPAHKSRRLTIFRFYDRVIDSVIIGVIPLMLIALCFAFFEALISMLHMIPLWQSQTTVPFSFHELVDRILDVIILIELFSAFMDYARTHRIHISSLIDMTIVFTLREILVLLYGQKFSAGDLVALCIVVIVLVIARSITIKLSPGASSRP